MSLGEKLTLDTYHEWFQSMLWLERLQCELDIQIYNQDNAPLFFVSEYCDEIQCIELEVYYNL